MDFITLEEYLIESTNNKSIYWVSTYGGETNDNDLKKSRNLFIPIYLKKTDIKKLDFNFNFPMLYAPAKNNKKDTLVYDKFNAGIKKSDKVQIYNNPKETNKSNSKVQFHKLMGDCSFIPKTVFTIKDAKNLKYPIVAKPSEGMSGVGIEKFDSHEDLLKSKNKFDLYSEAVKFDHEFRSIFLKDEMIILNERIHKIAENKTLDTKKPNEEIEFCFVTQDIKKVPNSIKKQILKIHKQIKTKINLDYYSLDFVIDENGNIKVFEINSAPGILTEKLCVIYEKIYKDFYGEDLDKDKKLFIKNLIFNARRKTYKEFKKEIETSIYPIDYTKYK